MLGKKHPVYFVVMRYKNTVLVTKITGSGQPKLFPFTEKYLENEATVMLGFVSTKTLELVARGDESRMLNKAEGPSGPSIVNFPWMSVEFSKQYFALEEGLSPYYE